MKRKAVRAITGLLCAALFLSNMAGISAFAMEDAGQGMRMQEYSLEDDTWEEEYEKVEDAKETVSENIVEDAFDVDVIPARVSFFPQVYSSGKFEADSLL